MPVSLAQAAQNAASDIDRIAIDEFRRSSFILDRMIWDDAVNPAGGGATLTYGYTRVTTAGTAGTRAINSEFTPQEAAKTQVTVNLKVFGGSFQLDRVLNRVGSAAANEYAFQMRQKLLATVGSYHDYFINGDSTSDANGFDGLSKTLTGSSTEVTPATAAADWTAVDDTPSAILALGGIDQLVSAMNGLPTVFLLNRDAYWKFMTVLRLANAYKDIDFGDGFRLPAYNGIPIVDLGDKNNTTNPIIATGSSGGSAGKTDIYAARLSLEGLHMISMAGQSPLQTYQPNWSLPGAVKTGEVEGVAAMALKATKAAAVLRGVKVK